VTISWNRTQPWQCFLHPHPVPPGAALTDPMQPAMEERAVNHPRDSENGSQMGRTSGHRGSGWVYTDLGTTQE